MTREELSLELVDQINSLGKDFDGFNLDRITDIPKINYPKYATINDLLKRLKLKDYSFHKIMNTNNDTSFNPKTLDFNLSFIHFLAANKDIILFSILTSNKKKYLIYLGKSMRPNYIWELVVEDTETVEPEAPKIKDDTDEDEF